MKVVDQHAAIEEITSASTSALGSARAPYRGHVYRVFNYTRQILGSDEHDDILAIASVFHDLGIWSDGTFDYLGPSIARAVAHLRAAESGLDQELVALLIENHHRLLRYKTGPNADLVDAFRRADLVDVSHGLISGGVSKGFRRELVGIFPYAGFHAVLLKTAAAWFIRHPLRPLPMLR